MRKDDGRDQRVATGDNEPAKLKIVPFSPKPSKREAEEARNHAEMVSMLEEALEALKAGEITGYVFVGRKTPSSEDAFDYIFANVMDIGLIGEINVLNHRLARMYDLYSTSNAGDGEDE